MPPLGETRVSARPDGASDAVDMQKLTKGILASFPTFAQQLNAKSRSRLRRDLHTLNQLSCAVTDGKLTDRYASIVNLKDGALISVKYLRLSGIHRTPRRPPTR